MTAITPGERDPNPARNIVWSALTNFAVPALALIQAPILAHSLGVVGRGEVAAATAPLFLLMFVAALGVPEAVTNSIAAMGGSPLAGFKKSVPILVASGLLATGIVAVFAKILAGGNADLALLMTACTAALTPILLVALSRGVAAGLHAWRVINIERVFTAVARVLAIVACALAGVIDPVLAALIVAFTPLLGIFPYVPLLVRLIRARRLEERAPAVAEVTWGYALRIWIGSLSGILLTRIDQVLITPLAGTFQLGLYVVAVNLSDVALLGNNAVRDVLFASDASERSNARVERAGRLSVLISALVGAPIIACSALLVSVLFGEDFSAATPMVVVLIIAAVMGVPGSVAGAALAARGRPGLRSASIAIGAAINVGAIFILVPLQGGLGAAFATLIGSFASATLCLYFGWKRESIAPWRMLVANRGDLRTLASTVGALGRKVGR